IEFKLKNRGSYHYASVEVFANEWLKEISKRPEVKEAALVGQMARKNQVVNKIEILAAVTAPLENFQVPDEIQLVLHQCSPESFVWEKFRLSAGPAHLDKLPMLQPGNFKSEEEIYHAVKLPFIPVEMRE